MIKEKDLRIITALRKNSRSTLVEIGSQSGIPVSTVFDRIRRIEKAYLTRHTSLLDFSSLRHFFRVAYIFRHEMGQERMNSFLKQSGCVNTAARISPGMKYMAECVFRNMAEMQNFAEMLREIGATEIAENHLVEDIKREEFLSDISHSKQK